MLRLIRPTLNQIRIQIDRAGLWWAILPPTLVFLFIEFFDELEYTVHGAALPVLRTELGLSYAQVGLLLGLPHVIGVIVDPVIFLLGDTLLRRKLMIGGGILVALSIALVSQSNSIVPLLMAMILGYSASGAFVSLCQATLMDLNPKREAQMMARWTAAGSVGNLLGPVLFTAGIYAGLTWRSIYLFLAVLPLILAALLAVQPLPSQPEAAPSSNRSLPAIRAAALAGVRTLFANLKAGIKNRSLLRWLLLIEFADLLLDILSEYAPLYFTDVVGFAPAQAGLVLTLLMLASLLSDLVAIPLLERYSGRKLVRTSALAAILCFSAWLLAPWPIIKVGLLAVTSLCTVGWYSVLQAEAYTSAPGKSGTVIALGSIAGIVGGGLTWLVGWLAGQWGLGNAIWLLLLGPITLVLLVPRGGSPDRKVDN